MAASTVFISEKPSVAQEFAAALAGICRGARREFQKEGRLSRVGEHDRDLVRRPSRLDVVPRGLRRPLQEVGAFDDPFYPRQVPLRGDRQRQEAVLDRVEDPHLPGREDDLHLHGLRARGRVHLPPRRAAGGREGQAAAARLDRLADAGGDPARDPRGEGRLRLRPARRRRVPAREGGLPDGHQLLARLNAPLLARDPGLPRAGQVRHRGRPRHDVRARHGREKGAGDPLLREDAVLPRLRPFRRSLLRSRVEAL